MTPWIPETVAVYQMVGLFGVALHVGAYAALQLGAVRGNGYTYPTVIIAAACCMLLSLWRDFNLASAVIQCFFITISLLGLTRRFILDRRVRFSADEKALLASKFADLPRHAARRLFDAGHWIDVEPGSVLATEDQPVANLLYLKQGRADVISGGKRIGECLPGTFIGEVTALTGTPATATVVAATAATVFAIDADRLRRLTGRDRELRNVVGQAFAADMRAKLHLSNRAQAARPSPE
ncbi:MULTISPECIES: cyclic nucleotide-binding domain-containing protein [unclassified Roseitalea]|uniref:cyclic nucleotide-binding domain-containing protein n=1 Tax=unclassified Roseitalea TaxID=2639107 RepID=UPI00273D1A70|nr:MULTISPECIES: cyclic nucleotide-binding domain-containing protein [unclassified Roseitalea]